MAKIEVMELVTARAINVPAGIVLVGVRWLGDRAKG